MTPKSFKAFWAIQETETGAPLVEKIDDSTYLDIIYLYKYEYLDTGLGGDYQLFDTEADPDDADRRRALAGVRGPLWAVEHTGGLEGALEDIAIRFGALASTYIPSEYEGYVLLDLESYWPPYWRRDLRAFDDDALVDPDVYLPARGSVEAIWRQHIRDTDPDSLDGKTREEQEDQVFAPTYIEVARACHDAIFNAMRAERPDAIIGEYGWPARDIFELTPFDPGDARKTYVLESNEKYIPRMARNWDFLAPNLYPVSRAIANNETPESGYDQYEGFWWQVHAPVCEEIIRVRDLCHGLPVYCHVTGICLDTDKPHFADPVSPRTGRLQVQLCRQFGFDGVIVWGAVFTGDEASKQNTGLAAMQPRIRNYVATTQNLIMSTNSSIGIRLLTP